MEEQLNELPEDAQAGTQELVLESKIFYQLDYDGRYVGEVLAWESPQDKLEGRPYVWLNPSNSVELPPPAYVEGKNRYYVDGVWEYRDIPVPEPEPEPPLPTPAQILALNTAKRDSLLFEAGLAIAPLQDAVDLEMATPQETAKLAEWKRYRVLVNRVDLTLAEPGWPAKPTPIQP